MLNQDGFMNDLWEIYGVKEDPFTTSPILVRGGSLKPECFVGRKDTLDKLGKILSSKGGSRTLVYGDVGVGKTSFVNVIRNCAEQKGYFTPFKEIAVQNDWNSEQFILATISGFYATLKLMTNKPISSDIFKKLESLFGIGTKEYNGGVDVLGCGFSFGKQTRDANNLNVINLSDFFQEMVEDINKNKKEIIIHYNNLELIEEENLRKLFDNLRDFFQTKSVHFIFVGNLTVHSNFQSIPRFSSILTDSILIETLSKKEIDEIIHKRFESLRISKDLTYILPFQEEALDSLFNLWGGNIRNILNSFSTAVLDVTKESPIILDKNLLAATLKKNLNNRLSKLQSKAKEVLMELVKYDEITNKGLSDKLNIARSNISSYLKDLHNEGCVYLKRKNGKDKYWCTEPKIKWILLKEDNNKIKQKSLFEYNLKNK